MPRDLQGLCAHAMLDPAGGEVCNGAFPTTTGSNWGGTLNQALAGKKKLYLPGPRWEQSSGNSGRKK